MDETPALYEAGGGGHEQWVIDLLIAGADPNRRNEENAVYPLHAAAKLGYDGIASTLLLGGADKDALDRIRRTPLMRASVAGHLSVVETLLAAGADVNIRDMCTYSALDHAASRGRADIIEAIAGHGGDVNAGGHDGYAALHVAAHSDQVDAVDALIAAGGDVELKTNAGSTPLASAAAYGNFEAALSLLQHGAKVDTRTKIGDTPLHLACLGRSEGLEAVADLLLRWGADETALNESGESPAEMLCVENENAHVTKPSTQGEIERTRLLLAHAPADRAWRRRCWLAMLRSRSEKARCARTSDSGSGSGGSGRQEDQGCKAAIRDEAGGGGGDQHVGRGQTSKDSGAGGGGAKDEALSGLVALLVGVEPEGVFRTIVGYL